MCIKPEELDNVGAYEAIGAQHVIVMMGNPYDLSGVEKFVAKNK